MRLHSANVIISTQDPKCQLNLLKLSAIIGTMNTLVQIHRNISTVLEPISVDISKDVWIIFKD